MKRIVPIFLILVFSVQPLFGQLTKPQTEGFSQSTQGDKSVDIGAQEADSAAGPLEHEEPLHTPVPSIARWEGKRRILKVVNDYQLAANEVLTTLVMIAGDARIHGTVTGNVLVLGGEVELAPGAQVNGMLQVIGGQIIGNMKAVQDFRVSNRWEVVPAAAKLLMHPHTVWGISKEGNFRLTVVKFVLFLLTYLLVVLIFPKPINAMSTLLAHRPIGSMLFSILMLAVIPLLLAVLALSIVGIPCLLLGIALLLPLALFGKAAIFLLIGSTLLAGRLKPLAVIFGYILYFMATEIRHIDWVAFLVVNTIGIGLCLLTCFSTQLMRRPGRDTSWSERMR